MTINAARSAVFPALLALLFLLPVTAAEPAAPEISRHPDHAVRIVAHRGANRHAPENTFAAAKLCHQWGVDYVEVDIATSKDGVLYVLHDRTVDRTTDGSGPIRALTSEQIDALDAGSWFHPRFAGERVPRLADFLAWAKGKVRVYLDVKSAHLPVLLDLIQQTGMRDHVFLWFGSRAKARELRRLDPTIPLKINADSIDELRLAKERFNAQIVEFGPDKLDDPAFLAEARRLGLKLMPYTTANDPAAFRRAVEVGADYFNLDWPDVFIRVEREVFEARQERD